MYGPDLLLDVRVYVYNVHIYTRTCTSNKGKLAWKGSILHYRLPLLPYIPLYLQSNHAMVIVHHSATAIIQYAKIARKQHLHSVCLDSLSKIHSIPSVPVLDCFQKIRQQVRLSYMYIICTVYSTCACTCIYRLLLVCTCT